MTRSTLTSIAALALVAGAAQSASAQSVSFTGANYTQDFDALATTGTTNAWANGTTINGWHAVFGPASVGNTTRDPSTGPVIQYIADTGSSTAGGLHSYGVAGVNALTERALGSIGSGSWEGAYALVIQNNAGFDLSSFTLAYDGEQWRNGGNATMAAHSLVFDYTILPALPVLADLNAANTTGYTAVPALNFTSPIVSTTAGALDGNLAANRIAGITSLVNASVPIGSFLVLRWWDTNDLGNDHGLAIDNLAFSAVPAPGAAALLGLGGLIAARRRRS